jgi:hypothetical protein
MRRLFDLGRVVSALADGSKPSNANYQSNLFIKTDRWEWVQSYAKVRCSRSSSLCPASLLSSFLFF